jgi:putative transposase
MDDAPRTGRSASAAQRTVTRLLVHRSYRLVLTDEQEARARRFAGCVRALYNAALEQRSLAYRITGRSPSRFAQDRELAELKHAPGLEWIADAAHHSLQQALLDLDRAFVRFFAGGAGYPTPRRKHRNDAFRFPDPSQIGVDARRHGWVRLPKLGWCRYRLSRPRPFEGRLRTVTVRHEGERWYVSFTAETEVAPPIGPKHAAVGVDRGVAVSVALSTGERVTCPPPPGASRRRSRSSSAASPARRRGQPTDAKPVDSSSPTAAAWPTASATPCISSPRVWRAGTGWCASRTYGSRT